MVLNIYIHRDNSKEEAKGKKGKEKAAPPSPPKPEPFLDFDKDLEI